MVGGIANSVYQLVTRLRELNHDVTVLTAGLDSYGYDGHVYRAYPILKITREWGDLLLCPSIYSALKDVECDIIHAHVPRKLFAEAVTLHKFTSKRKFPYVVSVRLLNTSLTGVWRGIYNLYQGAIERQVLNKATYVIVQTKTNRNIINKLYGIDNKKIRIIPNAVDSHIFCPDLYDPDKIKMEHGLEGRKVVLFVGRLTAQKGIRYLLSAIPRIRERVRDSVFLIIGDGPLMNTLKEKAHNQGIDSSIKFLGKIEHKHLPMYYAMSDVFILPSLSESFPNTMLEAMAMKKPIVITKVGVAPEILGNYKDAVLVEPAQSSELAKSVVTLLTDETLSKKLGENACKLVKKEYNWERVIEKTLVTYRDAIREH